MFAIPSIGRIAPAATLPAPESLRERLHARLDEATHLSTPEKAAAKRLVDALVADGHVGVPDSEAGRQEAVAGVQWAMESVLRGTECIVTPQRTTPFRTCGDPDQPEAQRARKDALIERLLRDDPLHLVFCHDGTGTPEEDQAYRAHILSRFESHGGLFAPGLHEHILAINRSAFPPNLSGGVILSDDGGKPVAFAIRAVQADLASAEGRLELSLGGVDEASIGDMLDRWTAVDENVGQLLVARA